ncbi:MAG: monovalent cation/H+ antiporter complex subunit F [Chloroflexota bacterium]
MQTVLVIIAVVVAAMMFVSGYRMVVGPTVFDRIIGVGVIGTKTIILLALIGFLYGRVEMFLDLAIAYALLNFIGTIAIAKYIERREVAK